LRGLVSKAAPHLLLGADMHERLKKRSRGENHGFGLDLRSVLKSHAARAAPVNNDLRDLTLQK
jgi:hypothetical protein